MFAPRDDLRDDVRCGFDVIKARGVDRIGVKCVIKKVKERVEDANMYILVIIDVLDPAFAPATGMYL